MAQASIINFSESRLEDIDNNIAVFNLIASALWVYSLADRFTNTSYNECTETIILVFSIAGLIIALLGFIRGKKAINV